MIYGITGLLSNKKTNYFYPLIKFILILNKISKVIKYSQTK
jgi:hypothetical protein